MITSKNLMNNGQLSFEDVNFISKEDYEFINKRSNVDTGDILFGMIGTIGNPVIVGQNPNFAIKNVALIKEQNILKNSFLIHYLNSPIIKRQFHKINDGGTQKFIALGKIRKLIINIPSKHEQNKLSDFFSKIDKKIELFEMKYNSYVNFKKYLMQQIFTQKLRFDFDVVKLKDISKINKGKQLNKDDMLDDGEFYVLNGGQEPSGYTNEWNTPENTITISEGGNSCGFVNFNKEKFWSGGHCYYLSDLSSQIDTYYLFSYLKFIELKIMRLRVGSGLPNIQKGDVENIKIKITDITEQNKISSMLKYTDKCIYSINAQKHNFEIFKKGLLQQMFV